MIDLHIHSHFSDGTDSIDEILATTKANGVHAISLTDHDTTYGISEILSKSIPMDIKVIPGVEVSSVSNGNYIHILGYNVNIEDSYFQGHINKISSYFKECFYKQFSWLRKNNLIDFDIEEVLDLMSFKQALYTTDIFKAMIYRGESYKFKDWPEFFQKVIKQYPSDFIKNFPYSSIQAVEAIKSAGGIPVFAHPARIGNADIAEMELLLPYGLSGVEVYYPYHDAPLIKRYEDFAFKHNLIKTGGTDWHGELTTWGSEIGDFGIDDISILCQTNNK